MLDGTQIYCQTCGETYAERIIEASELRKIKHCRCDVCFEDLENSLHTGVGVKIIHEEDLEID